MSSQLIPFTFEGTQVRTVQDSEAAGSPFEAIRRTTEAGGEYWSARDLMPLLGYERWERFADAMQRAKASAQVQGHNVEDLFRDAAKKSTGGRPREDFHLSRFACYLVAMNGDPRKSEVAAAQAYFAIRTREAEVATPKQLAGPELMAAALIEAQKTLDAARNQVLQLEARAEADRPKIVFADAVTAAKTTILVGELAKLLKQNGIDIGGTRLFAWMRCNGFLIARKGSDYNQPTQRAMDAGLFEVKETAITHSDGHVTVSRTPKVTGKGQAYFVTRFLDGRFTIDQGRVVLA